MSVEITCDEVGCRNDVTHFCCSSCVENLQQEAYDSGFEDGKEKAEEEFEAHPKETNQ